MKQLFYIILISLFCLNITTFAQNPEWIVYNTSNSGLPGNMVSAITIDAHGNKWIGEGENGLVKFDGQNWIVYNESNSELPSNGVWCIEIDKSGNKWIGTLFGGLAKFNGTTWTVYNVNNSGLPNNFIRCIAIDQSNNKWIGTQNGLVKYNDTTWTCYNTSNSGLPVNIISRIIVDNKSNKWIGTSGDGLVKFNDSTWTIFNRDNSILVHNTINDITIDASGNIWVLQGGWHRLFKIDHAGDWTEYVDTFQHKDDYWCIAIDNENNKWIGMNGPWGPTEIGLLKYDNSDWAYYDTTNSEIPGLSVSCITADDLGNVWMGMGGYNGYGGGLAVFNENGIATDVKNDIGIETVPEDFVLNQNYPNPFNPSTKIEYEIPGQARNDNNAVTLSGVEESVVTLKVYDILGREVATLVNEHQKPGYYEIHWNASINSSGVYFYKLNAGSFVETKKMILLR